MSFTLGLIRSSSIRLFRAAMPSRAFALHARPILSQQSSRALPIRPLLSSLSRRSLFIQVQPTPNPLSLKFLPGRPVLPPEMTGTVNFPNFKSTQGKSQLASKLFQIEGVTGVMFGSDFIVVSSKEGAEWLQIKPAVFAAITDHVITNAPFLTEQSLHDDTQIQETDDETVKLIKELIETRIRPSVQEDGGDIVFRQFVKETGTVKLEMQGSCVGCPSSSVTLKNGIENMLMHYVPEVERVEEWVDSDVAAASEDQLRKLEAKLDQVKQEQSTQQQTQKPMQTQTQTQTATPTPKPTPTFS